MPPKFLAVFSNLEKTRRHSFNQPIRRSTMFRLRYARLSNGTDLARRSSYSFEGITGFIPNASRYSSIHSARYPLSPAKATGQAIGFPSTSKSSSSALSSTASRKAASCRCPADNAKVSGWPSRSHSRWIFVVKPPRLRPIAWSGGSSGSFFSLHLQRIGPRERSCRQCTRVRD